MGENTEDHTQKESDVSILGQFKSKSFWKDFMKLLVQEAITMFLISIGTSLLHIGRKNKNRDIKSDTGDEGNLANKAFGGYSGSYGSSYSGVRYPLTTTNNPPNTDNPPKEFPGM